MKPPKDAKLIEWETSTSWFDEWGILCSISKKAPPQTMEQAKKSLKDLHGILEGRKVCLLVDVTYTSESTKEVRDFAAREFPKFVKAFAMISGSSLGTMLANLFFKVASQPYPVKMFTNEQEAKEWLKQYL